MSVPSNVLLIQDVTAQSGKVRILGTVLAYDVATACAVLEYAGSRIRVDISNLLTTYLEFGEVSIKVKVGEVVNVIGYVEELSPFLGGGSSEGLVIRAIMYWSPGRMSQEMLLNYGKIVAARHQLRHSFDLV